MPRKLKTYTTSIGFFDLAIAAPSMKAALEAWGLERNLFHQGLAEETDDPGIVAATLERPGVVLRRAVGAKGAFKENAELPTTLPADGWQRKPKTKTRPAKRAGALAAPSDKVQKAAVIQFEKEKAKRDRKREQEEADRQKADASEAREEERRKKAAEKAEAILERAHERHEEKMARLEKDRQAAEDAIDAERERWKLESDELKANIRKANR